MEQASIDLLFESLSAVGYMILGTVLFKVVEASYRKGLRSAGAVVLGGAVILFIWGASNTDAWITTSLLAGLFFLLLSVLGVKYFRSLTSEKVEGLKHLVESKRLIEAALDHYYPSAKPEEQRRIDALFRSYEKMQNLSPSHISITQL